MARLTPTAALGAVSLLLTACPSEPPSGEGGSSTSGGSEAGSTAMPPLTMSQTSTPSSTAVPDSTVTTDTAEGTTAEGETCVAGTWTGVLTMRFGTQFFDSCDDPGGSWWLVGGPGFACEDLLITIEGTLCGPGEYGSFGDFLYQLSGSVVGDPCVPAICGAEPTQCGTIEELCFPPLVECSLADQDCAAGDKCVPHAEKGAAPWIETRCVVVDPAPVGPGEACMRSGSDDDCALGWWCIPDVPGSEQGVCAELCTTETVCSAGACGACDGGGTLDFGVCVPPECMGAPGCPGAC